jgi:hypothetical protein
MSKKSVKSSTMSHGREGFDGVDVTTPEQPFTGRSGTAREQDGGGAEGKARQVRRENASTIISSECADADDQKGRERESDRHDVPHRPPATG